MSVPSKRGIVSEGAFSLLSHRRGRTRSGRDRVQELPFSGFRCRCQERFDRSSVTVAKEEPFSQSLPVRFISSIPWKFGKRPPTCPRSAGWGARVTSISRVWARRRNVSNDILDEFLSMEMRVAREVRLFFARGSWDIFLSRLSLLISAETPSRVFMVLLSNPSEGAMIKNVTFV